MDYIIYYAIYGFVFGFVCNAILKDKGYGTDENPNYGFWWGFFLGVLGLVVCCCKQRIETNTNDKKNIEGIQTTISQDLLDKGFWICPKCQKLYSQYAHSCDCGYNKE